MDGAPVRVRRVGGATDVPVACALAVHASLIASRDWGLAHLAELADEAHRAPGVDPAGCREYLAGLDYGLRFEHLNGLTEFFRRLESRRARPRQFARVSSPPRRFQRADSMPPDLLDLYTNAPLLELGAEADACASQSTRDGIVSYIVDRNINYTNVCVADCGFCAFYRRPKHAEGYTLSYEQIGAKIEETKELGGVQILIQGGHNPYIPFEWYLELLRYIKRNHPIHIHGFCPSEVDFFSQVFRMDARDVVRELKKAGLDSIPGGGGEILVQRVRDYAAPKKAGADRWLEIMEIAHQEGMKTSVTMMFGHRRNARRAARAPAARARRAGAHRRLHGVHHLAAATGEHARVLAHAKTDATEYLRTVAIARIVLDNVPNLQASWVTMGIKVGQTGAALRLQRFRVADDRGERRVRGQHDVPHDHGRKWNG